MKDDFKYFKLSDFDCQETGENKMKESFIRKLDRLREACGFPFYVTSGYRSPNHSLEKSKPNGGGTHTKGIAADIYVGGGRQRMQIVARAIELGFIGVGVAKTFVHVDMRDDFKPVLWCY
mgnify:FL=1|tara:strand:+ start:309 stop:668 length:360 start_codon:yes stop_codon:yes gene_type:complete